ncbi:MAG: hypothetical protein BGO51_23875 [Rhodospirillales bacterium 69-11]|nr:hypothetical protein [Rhodospirillales bacterium]OJW22284.1 MAG: hypothetical protein BGO51_23875 [Rhodospirillales bacterium 69-11]
MILVPPADRATDRTADLSLHCRQLRRAAAAVVRDRGMLRATPRAITAAARLPRSSFESCYPNRAALLAAVMRRHLDALTCWVLAAREAAATEEAAARLEAMIGAYLASALAERDAHRMLLRCADEPARADRDAVRRRGRGLAEMFGAVLAEAVPSADPAQVALVARSLCSAMSGAVLWFDPDGVLDLRAFARMLAAMALEGITPTP